MTTFEIIMTILAVLGVLLMGYAVAILHRGFKNTWHNQNCMYDLVNNADEYNTKLMQNIFDQLQETKIYTKGLEEIERTNQELLMPVIKWQRRLVGADGSMCETTNNE